MLDPIRKATPGRASDLASPDFQGFLMMFGLARTLAFPNWLFSDSLMLSTHSNFSI